MRLEPLKKLFREWREKKLEQGRAIGQMLQHLIRIEQRLERLEKGLPPRPMQGGEEE